MTAGGDGGADIEEIFGSWLSRFGSALERQAVDELIGAFDDDGYWKDILAFTWGYRTFGGKPDIARALRATIAETKPTRVRPAVGRVAPRQARRSARSVIEGYFDFDTAIGSGTGFVRLLLDPDHPSEPRIWILLTTLQELRGFSERVGDLRPTGEQYSYSFTGDNWTDERRAAQEFADGRADAPRKVYVFLDANCVYCAEFWADARPWVDSGKVQLRYVMVAVIAPTSVANAIVA